MNSIVLSSVNSDGTPIQAVFNASKGLNLESFTVADIELIDTTQQCFIIGPHFGQRKNELIHPSENSPLQSKQAGSSDPFPNGVGRWVAWNVENSSKDRFKAILSGKDLWQGDSLSMLEGQDFMIQAEGKIDPLGLSLKLSIVSDTGSLIGISNRYNLYGSSGFLKASVADQWLVHSQKIPISLPYGYDGNRLQLDFTKNMTGTFFPYPDPCDTTIELETARYKLLFSYTSACAENCWQLHRAVNENYLFLTVLSSQDPFHPNLSVSTLNFSWKIFAK